MAMVKTQEEKKQFERDIEQVYQVKDIKAKEKRLEGIKREEMEERARELGNKYIY